MDNSVSGDDRVNNHPGDSVETDREPEGADAASAPRVSPEIPHELPVLPVRDVVVFPGTVVPISIGREKSKRLTDAVLASNKMLGVFAQRREDTEDPGIDDIYRVGTVANVLKMLRMPDGTNSLLVHGVLRAGLEKFVETEPYWRALVHPHEDQFKPSVELEALAHNARQAAQKVIQLSPNVPDEALQILTSIEEPGPLADFLAANLSLGVVQKQELLETFDVADRLRTINATLNNQLEVLRLASKINSDVRAEIDKSQREYYLQEQLKAIRKELGEDDSLAATVLDLRERVRKAKMPEVVLAEAERELERFERIPQASPEHGVIRDYLDWLIQMPWSATTDDNLDLKHAEKILNADHHGLDDVKRRILECLAVRKLNPEGRAPILCFAGPPGVGKTSLGQSIARAMGRKFIRIALGGIRDEADIRGHRRTYIGSIPGRLIQEIRKAGTRNPLIMLDELDKIGADFRGDPGSALLEVLDPEQNHSFTDHYLGVPFDLSQVMFIGTANYMDPVEPALRDRMEEIELPGYTTAEKTEIARRFLVKRQIERNGLASAGVTFDTSTLRMIIEAYTREAGVRNLERDIGTVCRGLAAKVARGARIDATINADDIEEYLGPPRFDRDTAMRDGIPGVATGLAYTPVGGEIIFIEAAIMPGRGAFSVTGHIGGVMQESAQAALSVIRSRGEEWGIPVERLNEADIHIHVPAGGIPKDGPSAGVAMLTALFSLLTETIPDPSVGMTGEITLRGRVLPIGGVKEKLLAAHRAGLSKVILPKQNERDLHDVPAEARDALQFVFAEQVEDVLLAAIPTLSRAAESPAAPKKVKKTKKTKKTRKTRKTKKTKKAKKSKKSSKSEKSPARKKKSEKSAKKAKRATSRKTPTPGRKPRKKAASSKAAAKKKRPRAR